MNAFFEHSTRTRTSFEMAANRLGARIINWDMSSSSMAKGESFEDTLHTLNATHPDALILRHADYNAPHYATMIMDCPVINAGDSWRAHPTQALLDALTIRQHKGDLAGLRIAILGDIAHSRVAASDIELFTRLGAEIHIIAPPALMPDWDETKNLKLFTEIEAGLEECDIVMTLRLQKERMAKGLTGSDTDYHVQYGLSMERLSLARADALVMHPSPMNRGVEIDNEIADDPRRSLIRKQMANGVPVRMAVLEMCLSGSINTRD